MMNRMCKLATLAGLALLPSMAMAVVTPETEPNDTKARRTP